MILCSLPPGGTLLILPSLYSKTETEKMSLPELLPEIERLPRADKLRLMQFLVIDLAQQEGVTLLAADAEYPVWTPLHAYDAADTMLEMLNTHRAET
jgi:hypothetical protein